MSKLDKFLWVLSVLMELLLAAGIGFAVGSQCVSVFSFVCVSLTAMCFAGMELLNIAGKKK